MNVSRFFEHWGITEDPFRAEEARHDAVFRRLGAPVSHPDFEKILGSLDRASTSIVFGEKGAGKTAIRLQIEERIAQHNAANPSSRTLLLAYDDLNPILDRLHARAGAKDPSESLRKTRSVDHMDGVLALAARALADEALDAPAHKTRRAARNARLDLLTLQAVYDDRDGASARTHALRRRMRISRGRAALLWDAGVWLGWILPVGVLAGWWFGKETLPEWTPWLYVFYGALALWAIVLLKRLAWDRFRTARLARRVSNQLRALLRSREDLAESLAQLPPIAREPGRLPVDSREDTRYAMFDRVRSAMHMLGYGSAVVVVDRVDEPTLIHGEAERMRAVVWPILNHKLLQMDGIGFKLLLPIELRHALFRESSSFFQEARLDKQNLVERLSWSGATLYDLCTARLRACQKEGASPIALRDLFDPEVKPEDVVDALEQMRQPRDAFKLLYRCIQEHCADVTEESAKWTIPAYVLDSVRKREVERVDLLSRGVRPA